MILLSSPGVPALTQSLERRATERLGATVLQPSPEASAHSKTSIGIGCKFGNLFKSSTVMIPLQVITECGLPAPACMLAGFLIWGFQLALKLPVFLAFDWSLHALH